ncbi:iron complex transport system substrate-binding protein [Streptohalobacillus salinus]|uniref:Iron complex transport system substrate-binding protein n=1 Tax=Streptohalobacillus salinus TaxID=621096 RepID=A0A2V3WAK7_9BACI|nr:siderophore ABC transporter substrate-binding protein [Streptohalobacillus salinus]PXW91433.1 iron complex transport system substrate-binding protein [Streptohalobacillus salinus]
MKKWLIYLVVASIVLVIAACGEDTTDETSSDQDTETETETNQEQEEKTEIVVEHELGTTTVPVNPETIAVFDFGTIDSLDYLGVEVDALPTANVPSYLEKFEDEHYTNAGTLFEPDFETLANLNPDLIIISGRTQEAYDDLTELAPTIYLGVDTARYLESFEENVTLLGEIFEKETEAEEAVSTVKAEAEAVQALVSADETALIILTNDGSVNAYGPGSRFGIIHDELGVSPISEEIEASTHGQNISFEYIAEQNPDYLYVVDRNAVTGGDYTAETTLDNALINETKAKKNDQITYLTPDYWYVSSGGITSVSEMINEVKVSIAE